MKLLNIVIVSLLFILGACTTTEINISTYMDKEEQQLSQELAKSEYIIQRVGNKIVLIMPESVVFALNSHKLNAESLETLKTIVGVLKQYDKTQIIISGHTDNSGSEEINLKVSKKRAIVVTQFLRRNGLYNSRIIFVGHGYQQPIASNETAEGRAKNRRVEITIEPDISKF